MPCRNSGKTVKTIASNESNQVMRFLLAFEDEHAHLNERACLIA